jgi:hypothetical protein
MSGSALNIQSEREIRQMVRDHKKNVEQQRKDRAIRMEKRTEVRSQISREVATAVTSLRRGSSNSRAPQLRPASTRHTNF